MKRRVFTVIATGLILASFALAGCGQQVLEGNRLVNKANKKLNEAAGAIMKIESISKQMSALPQTEAGMKRGKNLALDGSDLAVQASIDVRRASEELREAKKLNLSEDFKTYLEMKILATEEMIGALGLTADYMRSSQTMFDAALKATTQTQLVPFVKKVSDLSKRAEKALNSSDKGQRDAEAFFKKKQILG